MDNAQVEQELEDLESRLERLRALYEQYFLGLEKLEPTVLRKDVDRKLWVLRREQIRNTGLRFKLQMIIQRYNTYQQYWTRIVREIENGTYRRDILKVAQRFGEKDAMTILGKKRAEQYKRLAANQLDRRHKRSGDGAEEEAAVERPSVEISVHEDDAPVSLSASDLEDFVEEDNDTPTPPRGLPPVHMFGEPDMESLLLAATFGVKSWADPPAPPPAAPYKPAGGPPGTSAIAAPPANPIPSAAPAVPPIAAPAPSPPSPSTATAPAKPGTSAPGQAVATAAKPSASSTQVKPGTAPSPSAAKSRVAELAAQMRAKKPDAAKPTDDELELDRLFDPSPAAPPRFAPTPPAAKPSPVPAKPATPSAATTTPIARPAASTPLPSAAPSTPIAKPAPAPQVSPPPAPQAPAPVAPSPIAQPAPSPPIARPAPPPVKLPSAPQPPVARPAPSPAAAGRSDDLSEQKMREIYAKYVGAKRAANESTAGITYDKLAASLRAQADKLKSSHPTRSVDFEIVTKDGKTALRPVVK